MSGPDLDTAMDKLEIAVETAESEKSEEAYKKLNRTTSDVCLVCGLVTSSCINAFTNNRQIRIVHLMRRALDIVPEKHKYHEFIMLRFKEICEYVDEVQERNRKREAVLAGNPS